MCTRIMHASSMSESLANLNAFGCPWVDEHMRSTIMRRLSKTILVVGVSMRHLAPHTCDAHEVHVCSDHACVEYE